MTTAAILFSEEFSLFLFTQGTRRINSDGCNNENGRE
jgi:hypothetical protein